MAYAGSGRAPRINRDTEVTMPTEILRCARGKILTQTAGTATNLYSWCHRLKDLPPRQSSAAEAGHIQRTIGTTEVVPFPRWLRRVWFSSQCCMRAALLP